MNKAETIDQISRSADIAKSDAGRVLGALEARIKAHSDAGERVMLRGLGSFSGYPNSVIDIFNLSRSVNHKLNFVAVVSG